MSDKHTPGPWTVRPNVDPKKRAFYGYEVFGATARRVAVTDTRGLMDEAAGANARLIAAAPEMLGAHLRISATLAAPGSAESKLDIIAQHVRDGMAACVGVPEGFVPPDQAMREQLHAQADELSILDGQLRSCRKEREAEFERAEKAEGLLRAALGALKARHESAERCQNACRAGDMTCATQRAEAVLARAKAAGYEPEGQ